MLKPGQTFTLNRRQWRVAYVNDSRAHCVSAATKEVTVRDNEGNVRTFTAQESGHLDISPNTPLELLRELR